jgi:hypothetical protein
MGHLMHHAGRAVNRALKPAGLKLVKAERPHFVAADTPGDPLAPAYAAKPAHYLVSVALEAMRGLQPIFFALGPHAANPYTETLRRYERGLLHEFSGSPLEQHYRSWRPANAAEAIGLDAEECHPALREAPAVNFVFPWESMAPSAVRRRAKIETENRGFGSALSADHGHQCVGPVSEEKGRLEFARFTRVYASIRDTGFRRSDTRDGDLRGRILRWGRRSVVIITTGAHRLAALSALNYQSVPVRICWPTVYRDDVALWPNVASRLFTEQQALAVFDRVFRGDWPKGVGYGPKDAMCASTLGE